VAKLVKWFAKLGRWVAKLMVARLLATTALWVRIQTSLKNTKKYVGEISKGVATLARQKYTEKLDTPRLLSNQTRVENLVTFKEKKSPIALLRNKKKTENDNSVHTMFCTSIPRGRMLCP
jgi:hypothetical protein